MGWGKRLSCSNCDFTEDYWVGVGMEGCGGEIFFDEVTGFFDYFRSREDFRHLEIPLYLGRKLKEFRGEKDEALLVCPKCGKHTIHDLGNALGLMWD